ncbi:MAG: hypothetical protein CVT64_00585 [Actinobacteria bacterium HGW-Actinobacteria-4]|nr:MAG: hypothetical protein CVT64_00585 [Actinobacteria bacterium HGW-Actinobacteria-4]
MPTSSGTVRVAAILTGTLVALVVLGATASAGTAPPLFEPAPDTYPSDGVRVMFLGDSITGSPGCWRSLVWRDLTDAGLDLGMVGTLHTDECGGLTNASGDTWDPDHAGFAGIRTSGVFVRIATEGLLQRTEPDVVAMLLGTNDFWSGANADAVLSQYTALLELMRRDNPDIVLVVGTVLPMSADQCSGCQAQIDALNAQLDQWAADASTAQSPVSIAVLHQGFDVDLHTYDGVHPNEAGNELIAQGWVPALSEAVAYRDTAGGGGFHPVAQLALFIGLTGAIWLVLRNTRLRREQLEGEAPQR